MTTARKGKPAPPVPGTPFEWARADPAALDAFDPASKTCTMNCGKHTHDPRSYKELKFMCDDCDCHAVPRELKGTPAMSEHDPNPDDEQARWDAMGAALAGADMDKLRALLEPIEQARATGAPQPFGDMAMELYYNLRDHVYGVPWDLPDDDDN